MWHLKKLSKSLAAGLLVLSYLLALQLPIFCQPGIVLTEKKYKMIEASLDKAQKALLQARKQIEKLEKIIAEQEIVLSKQNKILTMQSNLWMMLDQSSKMQEKDLKSEYWRGFKDGAIISGSVSLIIGASAGISIGITIPAG